MCDLLDIVLACKLAQRIMQCLRQLCGLHIVLFRINQSMTYWRSSHSPVLSAQPSTSPPCWPCTIQSVHNISCYLNIDKVWAISIVRSERIGCWMGWVLCPLHWMLSKSILVHILSHWKNLPSQSWVTCTNAVSIWHMSCLTPLQYWFQGIVSSVLVNIPTSGFSECSDFRFQHRAVTNVCVITKQHCRDLVMKLVDLCALGVWQSLM